MTDIWFWWWWWLCSFLHSPFTSSLWGTNILLHTLGHAVVQLAETLRYRPEVWGFYSRRCHYNFSINMILSALTQTLTWVPGIFPGGKGGRCLGLSTLPLSCADCHDIWEPQTLETLRACRDLCRDCFIFYKIFNWLQDSWVSAGFWSDYRIVKSVQDTAVTTG